MSMSEPLLGRGIDCTPSEYLRFVLAEYVGLAWFLLVAAAVGTAFEAVVLGSEGLWPGVLASDMGLAAVVVTAALLALKPAVFDVTRLYSAVSEKRLARAGVLLTALLVFGVFAARLPAGSLDAVPDVTDTLGQLPTPVLVAAAMLLVGLSVVFLSLVVVFSLAAGLVVGAGAGVLLDGVSPVAGTLAGGAFAGVLLPSLLLLDDRQVDQGSVTGAAVAVIGLLLAASNPGAAMLAAAPLAAALGAGLGDYDPSWPTMKRATNGLVALGYPDGASTVPGYRGTSPGTVRTTQTGSQNVSTRDVLSGAYEHALDSTTDGGTWLTVVGTALLLLVSPLYLFVPVFVLLGHLCRVLASAAHGYRHAPGFSLLGRRATFKEGVVGLVGLSPYLLVALLLATPILRPTALPVEETPLAAVVLAVPALALVVALLPAVATSYAVDGRLRGAFAVRRIAEIVARPDYLRHCLVQGLLLTVALCIAFVCVGVGRLAAQIGGLPGLLVALTAGVGVASVGWAMVFVSASLWGRYYYYNRTTFRYTPSELTGVPLLQRLLRIDEGGHTVVGVPRDTLDTTGSVDRQRDTDDDWEYRGIE
jgi:hypothetical protein